MLNKQIVYYFFIIGLTVFIDQLSKLLITRHFHIYQSKVIIPDFFNLTYVTNKGAAFSFLADVEAIWRHYFFLGVGSVACILLTVFWYRQKKKSCIVTSALALITGGALGNLIDRVRFGAVIDFADFYIGSYHWPAFNIADSAICVGVSLFIFLTYREGKEKIESTR